MEASLPANQDSLDALPPHLVMLQMATGNWVSQCIYAAAKLGIADLLKTGEKSCDELAMLTKSHAPSLYRLLRALAGMGVFAETEPRQFVLTPLAQCLRSEVPESIRGTSIMLGDRELYDSWGDILHSIQTGESGFEHLFDMNVAEYCAENPETAAVIDQGMTSLSSTEIAAVVASYDFSSIRHLIDVAGGEGSLLTTILKANPQMEGVLFDLPEVIERVKPRIAQEAIADRCQLVAGGFFESVPAGADVYLLKHILHDWDDERSVAILKNCYNAMAANSKLLVVEMVIPPGNALFMGKLLDMHMLMVCPGGKERTEEEYRALFEAAGFQLTRIVPTQNAASVLKE